MIKKCRICGIMINNSEINKAFRISLGNIIDNKFKPIESFLCHQNCLDIDKKSEKFIPRNTQISILN